MRLAVAALLLVYAAAVLSVGVWWLPRAEWPRWAPRAGIAAWLSGALSIMLAWAGAGLILAFPCIQVSADPARLRACLSMLQTQYASPAGATMGAVGALLTTLAVGRVTWFYASAAIAARCRRASYDDALVVLARPGPAADVRIIDNDLPMVYCLPGRRRIVLTTGTLSHLDPGQLDAVLAHERAHLSGRHHVMLRLAGALERAFPRVRFFAVATQQITYLVEVAADDAALRRAPRLTLAAALLTVAASGAPAGALGAGGSAAARRIERLIDPPLRASMARRFVTSAVLAAAVLAVTALTVAFVTIIHCPWVHRARKLSLAASSGASTFNAMTQLRRRFSAW